MGLAEILVAVSLCANITCPGDPDPVSLKLGEYHRLIDELKNETLTITTLKNGDLSGLQIVNGSIEGTGVAFDLVKILQNKFGFTYILKEPEENVFGNAKTGVYSLLLNGEVDFAAGFLPIVTSLREEISYSPMLDSGEWVVMMRRPKESATGSNLLAPFTQPVWLLILLSLLVVGPVIYLLILLKSKLCKNENNKVFPMPSCIWFVYGALLKQGTTLNPVTDSSRLLFATWWIFITILTAFYTANLTAFLTLSKFTLTITNPNDIGKKHSKWVSNKGNAIEESLTADSTDPNTIVDSLMGVIGPAFAYPDMEDQRILSEYVQKRDIMFIRERPIADYILYDDYKRKTKDGIKEEERCTYVITKFAVTSNNRAFAFSKKFKYKQVFDSAIQHLVESGIIHFKLKEQLPDTEICPLNLGNTERRLRNSDLIMTYLIVGGGLVISAVVFVIEILLIFLKKKYGNEKHPHRPITQNLRVFGGLNENLFNRKTHVTPPPSYNTIYNPQFSDKQKEWKKKQINGREYWVVNSNQGGYELIPLRTPSALLFQYSN